MIKATRPKIAIPKLIIKTHLRPNLSEIIGTKVKVVITPMKYIDPIRPILYLGSQSKSNFASQLSKYSGLLVSG